MKPLGLLVMHYGTPGSLDEVEAYYTHIRHGRPPEPDALQDLIDRYKAIGGPSPLAAISRDQGEAIQAGLAKRGVNAALYMGAKHAEPFVADAVRQMARDGVERAVGVVLAPHFSTFSVAAYKKYACSGLEDGSGLDLEFIERWGEEPALIRALADRVRAAMAGFDPATTLVVFTAHSLPEKIVAAGDPYTDELMATSRLVAEASVAPHWTFAFQSASKTGEPWLGPDILDVIEERAAEFENIVACTVGFVSDHLEVLYDLGIEVRDKCAELRLGFHRADTIGADPAVMDALAGLCAERLTEAARR